MLSEEYTIKEIYKYVNNLFKNNPITDIENILNNVKWEILYDYFSEEYINQVIQGISTSASSREDFLTTLSASQRYMFFAEVYYTCFYYIRFVEEKEKAEDGLENFKGNFSVEGYSTSETQDEDTGSEYAKVLNSYHNKAKYMMLKAGYDIVSSISRTRPRGY